jgi:hypothetical protein
LDAVSGWMPAGLLAGCWLVDPDAAVTAGVVQVVQPLAPPGDGSLAAVGRGAGGMWEGGGELLGGDEPAVVGPQLVPGDDLGVVVGLEVLVPGVQVGDQRRARVDGVAAVDGVEVGVVVVAGAAVGGWLGEGWGGTWRVMPV